MTPKPTEVGCVLFAKAGPDGHRKGGWLLPSAQVPDIQLPGVSATFLVSVLIQFVIFIEPGGGNFHQLGLKCLVFHRDELFQLFTVLVGDRVHLHHIAGDAFSFVSIIVGGALFIGLRVAVFFNGIGKYCVLLTNVEEVVDNLEEDRIALVVGHFNDVGFIALLRALLRGFIFVQRYHLFSVMLPGILSGFLIFP